ncbi:YicC/YloC family endoribonuclease [Shimia biformata]|uniref:YicC/YloC family endoribonuclease n=1 Tax=Shimia biformata TaxID=1294299 RepID=UPI001950C811|nr:YicC/YloC family endoribonuclease [Shimia biformata]
MTGFATQKGALGPHSWTWDMRAVNSKGLDLRLRVPDWIEGLEPAIRAELGKRLGRGSVSLGLRVQRDEAEGALTLNAAQLSRVLDAIAETEAEAAKRDISLSTSKASDIIALRGVLDAPSDDQDTAALKAAMLAELPEVIDAFLAMRRTEGAALAAVLTEQLDRIAALTEDAAAMLEDRQTEMAANLKKNLARVLDNTDGMDEARLAQELALIAVKSDVTEEIDRLRAHVGAARDLLTQGSPVGRKLDFLMQEFNREANTLCSKAQNSDLTAIGLDLKVVIDQMREQVQNVE